MLRHQGDQNLWEGSGVSTRQSWGSGGNHWEFSLVLDRRPMVLKSHLEFVLQAAASQKERLLSGELIGLGLCFRKITGSLGEDEVTVLRAERDRAQCCQLE